jgi:hypothetical protein
MTTARLELPKGYPLDPQALQVGDRVRLIKLDRSIFKHLMPDELAFLEGNVGKESDVLSFDVCGHAEIEFWEDPVDGRGYCIFV